VKSPGMTVPGNTGVIGWWHDIVSHGRSCPFFSRHESAGDPILLDQALTMIYEPMGPDKPSKKSPHTCEVELAAAARRDWADRAMRWSSVLFLVVAMWPALRPCDAYRDSLDRPTNLDGDLLTLGL